MKEVKLTILALWFLLFTNVSWASFDGDPYNDLFMVLSYPSQTEPGTFDGQLWWYEYYPDYPTSPVGWRVLDYEGDPNDGVCIGEPFTAVAIGNFDGDKYIDLLVGTSGKIRWYEAYANDTSTLVANIPVPYPVREMKLTNLETGHNGTIGMGSLYVATGDPSSGGAVLKLDAVGNNETHLYTLMQWFDKLYNAVCPYDLDSDGKTELVVGWGTRPGVGDPNLGKVWLYEITEPNIVLPVRALVEDRSGGDDIIAGDFDGDSLTDVFVSSGGSGGPQAGRVQWFEADGTDNGVRGDLTPIVMQGRAQHLILADFDGDSYKDLLASKYGYNTSGSPIRGTLWFEATGNNTLANPGTFSSQYNSSCLAAGDWDQDAYTDLFQGSGLNVNGVTRTKVNYDEATGDNTFAYVVAPWSGQTYVTEAVMANGPDFCGENGTVYAQFDLNFDCIEDFKDLKLFADNWLNSNNFGDFANLAEFWMQDTNPAY